jgi:hypothetical protein
VKPIYVGCPECQAMIPVAVAVAELASDEEGRLCCRIEPDMTDMFAHFWTHADE